MTEHELRIALLADIDQPYDAKRSSVQTPRQAAIGAATDFLGWLAVVAVLSWVGIFHGNDGQPSESLGSFMSAMADVAGVWICGIGALLIIGLIVIALRASGGAQSWMK